MSTKKTYTMEMSATFRDQAATTLDAVIQSLMITSPMQAITHIDDLKALRKLILDAKLKGGE